MKIEKVIMTTQEQELEIKEVTLLSECEYTEYETNIPPANEWWWLRSPGDSRYDATTVNYDGSLSDYDVDSSSGCVRPALKISNLQSSNLQIGDTFYMAGYSWTVIGEGLALCNQCVGQTAFRKEWHADDANDYDASDIKKWLAEWAANNGIKCGR